MTLQNGLIHNRRGYLWSSTATWDAETQQSCGDVSKVFIGTKWPWAAVATGFMEMAQPYMAQEMIADTDPQSVSDLLNAARQAVREVSDRVGIFRLLLCGSNSRSGPEMFLIASDPVCGADPFVPVPIGEYYSSGRGDAKFDAYVQRPCTPNRMRKLIRYQASLRGGTVIEGFEGPPIAGNIIEAEVSAGGVKLKELYRLNSEETA